MMYSLSIVIPTYNRADTLVHTLSALYKACDRGIDSIEVVVVDDGSTDDTPAAVRDIAEQFQGKGLAAKFLRQENKGPAAARNLGWRSANAKRVLFIGDDIILTPTTLQVHLDAAEQFTNADRWILQGSITWDSDCCSISPFMRWWERQRFKFPVSSGVAPFWVFYTCNVSVPYCCLVQSGGFDEAFPYAAFEDTELSLRLVNLGYKVYYDADALAYHNHPTDLQGAFHQMELVGRSSALFVSRTGLRVLPRLWRWTSLGPWMQPAFIRFLYQKVDRTMSFQLWCWAAVVVLTYAYLVGKGDKPAIDLRH